MSLADDFAIVRETASFPLSFQLNTAAGQGRPSSDPKINSRRMPPITNMDKTPPDAAASEADEHAAGQHAKSSPDAQRTQLASIPEGQSTAGQHEPRAAPSSTVGKRARLAIIVLIVSSNMVQMISNMVGLAAGLEISKSLGVPVGPGQANWAAASYPLTQGTFILVSGRLGTVYGHRHVLVAGAVWLVVWSLANGFCTGFVSFNVARAMSGVGGALIMPNAVALLSTTIPPGRTRNVTLGFFGASAPIGSYLGAVWAGIFVQFATWKWIFWGLAMVGAVVFGLLGYLVPTDRPLDKHGKVDWLGAVLGAGGLILFDIVWKLRRAAGTRPWSSCCSSSPSSSWSPSSSGSRGLPAPPSCPSASGRRPPSPP
ncbi:hypothetical protein VTK73DRAFT_9075 [Phialemonium thermophilum]|uniref:Major facilitator superfamily (MFS) profile domain-containing protein n=1 Tax=Phialemonium thermophilum TaxID=223376 RepID=A0ABR3W4L8_9PEZI